MQKSPQLREALKKVAAAVGAMEVAQSLEQFEEAWKEFLHVTERLWNKSQAHFKKSPKWAGWAGRFFSQRAKDELLSYLINARGAEEHSVEAVTGREAGGFGINPAAGNDLYIESMTVSNGSVSIKSPQALKITFYPDRIKLLPVVNRGRTYPVPSTHLGNPVDSTNVLAISRTVYAYYSGFLDDAEAYLCSV